MTVVASGAKAILDLPATLEALETNGVPVIAFGQNSFRLLVKSSASPPRRAWTIPRRLPPHT